ncbi:PP2C family protein-serine/threonine phosphatase [Streptomyces afghaniensis]|uniref:PP2C family protein-serine/threonine phosphatase n=1 Tax=Streptomyces afghaniensis TaxID=66865 RepID=UPI0027852209|nr:SpoIIE family protein phosphatase [Streptomyces afghaniensis]MDQ1017595.1 serine phosphatase RsbU (regulator of sigma subunit) [Streptomyces afghaniensis]
MRKPQIDYAAVFRALPGMVALLTPDLVYADANEDFLRLAGRTREQLLGRYIFDVFPENPNDPAAAGMRETQASMLRVVTTGERDTMALLRYDIEDRERPGHWVEHFWSPVNAPVLDADGNVVLIVHRVEEITELIHARGGAGSDSGRARVLEAELYTRARELQELNERLRRAQARDREVALALQEAMLPAPGPVGHHRAAVRYRPAIGTLNVCGDWYDLVDLPGDRIAVAVGDVVGHGLRAAGVMGQLRSALSAAARVADGPARALEALGLYARHVEGAESTTVVKTFIDWDSHTLTYSSAGHLPPALLGHDGTVTFLDRATDPPLGARPEHIARPEADLPFAEGDILVLYTDGLVERRDEDIDAGLARLAGSLVRHGRSGPEALADALLADLLPPGGNTDDTALVVIRL